MPYANDWMLSDVVEVKGVRYAIALSSDGLVIARSEQTDRVTAERLAAACAGLGGLARGVGAVVGADREEPRQVMVEFGSFFLFVRGAGDRSLLVVVTEPTVNPGLIAQQMQAQVLKIGETALSTPIRPITEA